MLAWHCVPHPHRRGDRRTMHTTGALRMSQKTVVVLNGPNLNLLGEREPEVYGHDTLAEIEALCRKAAGLAGLEVDFRQSNHEGALIDAIHDVRRTAVGIVINAASLTHTSIGLRDALAALSI